MTILGLSLSPHDSSAVIVKDGKVVCAIEEEKLSRIRHCMSYDTSKYTLETEGEYFDSNFLNPSPEAVSKKIDSFKQYFKECGGQVLGDEKIDMVIGSNLLGTNVPVRVYVNVNHHLAHASHAFYTSPYKEAAILVIDGCGDAQNGKLETVSMYKGKGNKIELFRKIEGEIDHPTNTIIALKNSIGILYQNATVLCGFGPFGEGTLMGLASFGKPRFADEYMKFCSIQNEVYEIDNLGLYEYLQKEIGENATEAYKADVAASIQEVTNTLIMFYVTQLKEETGLENLCYAGGVALNATSNTHILNRSGFKRIYIPSAPGDGGTSIGAALYGYYMVQHSERIVPDTIPTVYMGKTYTEEQIAEALEEYAERIEIVETGDHAINATAKLIDDGQIIGWFQGPSEFGPRALGNRSILASPIRSENRDRLNEIKVRQSFRPVAPVMLADSVHDYFVLPKDKTADSLAYMLFTSGPKEGVTDKVPAVIHADNTARVQTISKEQNPKFVQLLEAFKERSGVPILINTSFNTKGEPMVETPQEAIETFLETSIDYLTLGNTLIKKHG